MTRAFPARSVGLVAVGLLILVASFVALPRLAAERTQALAVAHAWAVQSLPAGVADSARVELQPTVYGWRVVYRNVDVPCAATSWGCRAGPSRSDESLVYTDLWACVEYGTGRGYFFGVSIRSVAPVGPTTCRRPALQPTPVPPA